MKPKLRIEDDGRRDKGAGEGKTKLGKVEDLEVQIWKDLV